MKRLLFEYVVLPAAVAAFILGFWFVAGHQYAADIEAQMVANTQTEGRP